MKFLFIPLILFSSLAASGNKNQKSVDRTFKIILRDYSDSLPIKNIEIIVVESQSCTNCSKACEDCSKEAGPTKPAHREEPYIYYPKDPREFKSRTNDRGEATFNLPPPRTDYVTAAIQVPEYFGWPNELLERKYKITRDSSYHETVDRREYLKRILRINLIPLKMVVIRNETQAIRASKENNEIKTWLKNNPGAVITCKNNGLNWQVGYGYENRYKRLVLIDALDGSAQIIGRWIP